MSNRRTNWGRWGGSDERGMLNELTQDRVMAALRMVDSGKVYSLGAPVGRDGPVHASRNTSWHIMSVINNNPEPGGEGGADDILVTQCHASTHIDALCHAWAESQLYNGHPASEVTPAGAQKCGVQNIEWVVTRGVMLDIPGLKGVDRVDGKYAVTPQDLDDAAYRQKSEIRSGDAVLVRTGWYKTFAEGKADLGGDYPGVSRTVCDWLYDHDVVALGADNVAVEIYPPEPESNGGLPVHQTMLRDLGGYLVEFLNLEELAKDKVYEFLFVAAPLRISGGVGSPINPLAIV